MQGDEEVGVVLLGHEGPLDEGQVYVRVPGEDDLEVPVVVENVRKGLGDEQVVFLFGALSGSGSAVDSAVARVEHHDDFAVRGQIGGYGKGGRREAYGNQKDQKQDPEGLMHVVSS